MIWKSDVVWTGPGGPDGAPSAVSHVRIRTYFWVKYVRIQLCTYRTYCVRIYVRIFAYVLQNGRTYCVRINRKNTYSVPQEYVRKYVRPLKQYVHNCIRTYSVRIAYVFVCIPYVFVRILSVFVRIAYVLRTYSSVFVRILSVLENRCPYVFRTYCIEHQYVFCVKIQT